MVQTVRLTMDIPELLYTVADVAVVLVVRVHRCRRGEDSRVPTVALGEKLVMLRPLRVWALLGAGPCTQVQGRGSCPQGHGLHN